MDHNDYFVASFDNISTSGKFSLGQLQPDSNWDCGMGDSIATIDANGVQDTYYTYSDGNWYVCDEWGTIEGEPVNDTLLDVNVGLLVYSFSGSVMTFNGSVAQGDCEVFVEMDHNAYSGNFTPAPLKIGDIVPSADWDSGMGDSIATLDANGVQDTYYTYSNGDWYVCDEWGTPEGEPINETVVFQPNFVFLTYSFGGATLSFPSPLPQQSN